MYNAAPYFLKPLKASCYRAEPLFYRPFSGFYSAEIETLNPPEMSPGRVFEEQEGLFFINPRVFQPGADTENRLDRDFKSLVDSLIQ